MTFSEAAEELLAVSISAYLGGEKRSPRLNKQSRRRSEPSMRWTDNAAVSLPSTKRADQLGKDGPRRRRP